MQCFQENKNHMKHLSEPKFLVIDDDAEILGMLEAVFFENGYPQIETAIDYETGRKLLETQDFDLIICDIMLGEKTGIDLLDAMKRIGLSSPVILITGKPDLDTAIAAIRKGAFDYIRKPIKVKPLLETVERALAQHRERADGRNKEHSQGVRLDLELETYQLHLEQLRQQIDSAVDVYRDLVKLRQNPCSLEIHWRHQPLSDLGGDFIDIRETRDRIDLIVADVAGHDIGSSFYTILLKAFFEENCYKGNDGETLFRLLNQHLLESGKDERMITALFCRIYLADFTAELVSAAHPWLAILRQGEAQPRRPLGGKGSDVLGIHERPVFLKEYLRLESDDRLLIYTDGIANAARLDTAGGRKKRMDQEALDRLMLGGQDLFLKEMITSVWCGVLGYCDRRPGDDMLLAGVEIP